MVKITPIRNILYTTNNPIKKVRNNRIIPRLFTGIAITTTPVLLSNCSKIETPLIQQEITHSTATNLTNILNNLGLIKDSNKLKNIVNIGFSDSDGNRNYVKFKKFSEEKIEAEYLKLNAEKKPIDSAQLIIEKFDKDIKLNISKENYDNITHLYKIENEKVIQYVENSGLFIPNSILQKNNSGFVQIFNDNDEKLFDDIQNNEVIVILDDSVNTVEDDIIFYI